MSLVPCGESGWGESLPPTPPLVVPRAMSLVPTLMQGENLSGHLSPPPENETAQQGVVLMEDAPLVSVHQVAHLGAHRAS